MGPNSFGFPLSVPFQGHLINACQSHELRNEMVEELNVS
jgi:hypothetical protein